jgi:hypothetical protein
MFQRLSPYLDKSFAIERGNEEIIESVKKGLLIIMELKVKEE